MKEVRCPFCGRTVTDGKYCMLCGNPLKRAAEEKQQPGTPQEEKWNPEKTYASSVRRMLVIGVLILTAAVVWLVALRKSGETPPETDARPGQDVFTGIVTGDRGDSSFSPACGIREGMTIEEMTDCMEKAGFVASGSSYTEYGDECRKFQSSKVLGFRTIYSEIRLNKNGQQTIFHHYHETDRELHSNSDQGLIFSSLMRSLSVRYGSPEISLSRKFTWKTEEGILTLTYSVMNMLELQISVTSVS